MIYTSFCPRSAVLLLHAEQVLGGGGVLIVELGGAPLQLSLHHSEVPFGELLCEAASEGQFNRHHISFRGKFYHCFCLFKHIVKSLIQLQGLAKKRSPGLVNFVAAVASS